MWIVAFGNAGRFTGVCTKSGVLEVLDLPDRYSNLSPLIGTFASEDEALDYLTKNYPEAFENDYLTDD